MKQVDFKGHSGETLAARLDLPSGKPLGYALFAHCFTCTKDVFAASRVSQALSGQGFAVLRFDFTGLGASDGDFSNTNFSSNVQDLILAADFLRQHYEAPKLLIGHSLGGAAVLAAAGDIPEADAVATIGAPSDPEHVKHLFTDAECDIQQQGEAEVLLAGRPFKIQKQFLEDIASQSLKDKIHQLGKALIVFHSPQDATVEIDQARLIYQAALHPKSFVSLDGADHLLTRKQDAEYVADVLNAWVRRYIDIGNARNTAQPEDNTVIVTETGRSRFQQDIRIGRHVLTADEPVSAGGEDTGPSPYDYLLAGLGACTNMTLRMYAQHKDIPLDKSSVSLRHEKIHASDCEDCETREGKIDQIQRVIQLDGELTEAHRVRLLEIAEKCPVHRTLHSEIRIKSSLSD